MGCSISKVAGFTGDTLNRQDCSQLTGRLAKKSLSIESNVLLKVLHLMTQGWVLGYDSLAIKTHGETAVESHGHT